MKITVSPVKKFSIMTGMVILFSVFIHFAIVPNIGVLTNIQLPTAVRIFLTVIIWLFVFACFTYANMYRPLVPGAPSWKQEKYWKPMTIEKSPIGTVKFVFWVLKIFVFSAILYVVLSITLHLYIKNVPAIMNETYVYNRAEAAFMLTPIIMVFLVLLYVIVKWYDKFTEKRGKTE